MLMDVDKIDQIGEMLMNIMDKYMDVTHFCIWCIHQSMYMTVLMIVYVHVEKLLSSIFGNVSKPCTPGEHQNSW